MRGCRVIIILLLAFNSAAAQDITGFWSGKLFNDSTGKYQSYEVVIAKNGTRYEAVTRTQFFVNDASYFAIKRASVKISGNKIIITDLTTLFENYPVNAPKGIRQLNVLTLADDSLRGPFVTNTTKKYSEVTGNVFLQKKSDKAGKELAALLNNSKQTGLRKNNTPPAKILAAAAKITLPAAERTLRKTEVQATVLFNSDTLRLRLYDNGIVDGDTVTILVNNKVILAKQALGNLPVYYNLIIPATEDSVLLLMYAENLGSIPPNTGLLIIQEGNKRTELRLSGNLQQNAAILFKRKRIIKDGSDYNR